MRTLPFVPQAEAAFIAGISSSQLDYIVDEHIVPNDLLDLKEPIRRYARLVAPLARFYFKTESTLVAAVRRDVINELFRRVQELRTPEPIWALTDMPREFNWKVSKPNIVIDPFCFFVEAYLNAKKVDLAEALVVEDDEIMGGLPCFAKSRVPISNVLGSLDEGMTLNEVRDHYFFLTEAHIAVARVYAEIHPQRGSPRRWGDVLGQPRVSIKTPRKEDVLNQPRETIKIEGAGT
jgi:uncharacterized protein (DUF433 family)